MSCREIEAIYPRPGDARQLYPARGRLRERAVYAGHAHGAHVFHGRCHGLDELDAWLQRTEDALGAGSVTYTCELKIDGLGVALTYQNGAFVRAATRGDGTTGEDVSLNVRTIKDVPMHLSSRRSLTWAPTVSATIEVRGEVYMPKGSFVRLNDEADAEGRDPFANPRNAAAGSLRQKDPKVTARRDGFTFIYAIADTDPLHVHSQREFLDWLRSAGFSVNQRGPLRHAG